MLDLFLAVEGQTGLDTWSISGNYFLWSTAVMLGWCSDVNKESRTYGTSELCIRFAKALGVDPPLGSRSPLGSGSPFRSSDWLREITWVLGGVCYGNGSGADLFWISEPLIDSERSHDFGSRFAPDPLPIPSRSPPNPLFILSIWLA